MPESVNDRFAKKHEYIFLMTKAKKYYFDLDSIRDKHIWGNDKRNDGKRHEYKEGAKAYDDKKIGIKAVSFNPLGKNLLVIKLSADTNFFTKTNAVGS